MNWPALLNTILLCGISIFIEAISATREGKQWFENLNRPRFSFSLQVWYFVGAVYYIIFGIVAYRQFAAGMSFTSLPVILLAGMMLLNGFSNFVAFKFRSIKWFYFIIYPFALFLLALMFVLGERGDKISALLASIYFLWLFYDLYWGHQMWKLNDDKV